MLLNFTKFHQEITRNLRRRPERRQAAQCALRTDEQRRPYNSEVLKKGASGNLPRINFRLPKTAASEQVALQAQRLRYGIRSAQACGRDALKLNN